MITVKLYTGQVLTFPDGTPESVIRAAAERATQAAKSKIDLSSLQGKTGEQVGGTSGPRLQQDADLGIKLKPREPAQEELPERSPEFWRSVSGSPSSKAAEYKRQSELRAAEESGAGAMARLGFEDHETYYHNPATDERVTKKRKTGNLPGPLDAGYRPESAADRLHEIYEAEGRPVPTSEELEARSEFVRGVPSRVMGSMAGLALPFQATESLGRGLKEEAKDLITGEHIGRPTGEGLHRGARQGWTESPITRGAAVIQEEVVEPARERYLDAAIRAGMSPESAALAETGQMITGEALNPGNYIGLEMLRTGAQMARTTPAAIARRAAQESVGGARSVDEAGLVTREFGRGSASSEIAQAKAARSGEFLPGAAQEPLLYRDPAGYGGYKWKGVIPDAIREAQGKPWRTYRNVEMQAQGLGRVPLDRPIGPEPRPRSVEGRQPLPMEVAGGTPEQQAKIGGLWDYASRRYPTIASKVKRLEIGPDPFFDEDNGLLVLAPDSNLGAMMHELTHVAQAARGKLARDAQGYPIPGIVEPAAMRADDVYSRIPQPQPRPVAGVIGAEQALVPGAKARVYGDDDISERFASFLSRAGIDDPELYYDLDPAQRTILDRQFAANDAGPDTVAWSAYLLEHNLRPDDYTTMSLADRAKLETDFRLRVAEQTPYADPDANLPNYFYDANSGGWKVEGSDQVFGKEWQAQEFRESIRGSGSRVGADAGDRRSWLDRLLGRETEPTSIAPAQAPASLSAVVPVEAPRLRFRPEATAAGPEKAIADFKLKTATYAEAGQPLSAGDLPFELRDLPLSRWSNADPSRRIRGTNPAHWDFDRAGGYWRLGDDTTYHGDPDRGGRYPVTESFTPENPLILPDHQTGFDLLKESGWKPSDGQNARYAKMHSTGGPWEDRYLNDFARSRGHDSIIILDAAPGKADDIIEVIKLNEGMVGTRRTSPYLRSFEGWADEITGSGFSDASPQMRERMMRGYMQRAGVDPWNGEGEASPVYWLQAADQVERETGSALVADMLREKAGPLWRATTNKPYRVYADQGVGKAGNVDNPLAGQPVPAAIAPALPEEQAARAMGWIPPADPPGTLYHGTNADLDALDPGAWVAQSREEAELWATVKASKKGGQPRVYAVPPEAAPQWNDIGSPAGKRIGTTTARVSVRAASPTGSPHAVGPPIKTPDFQTNIAAQLGGADDPQAQQVANYIIQESDAVFKATGPPQSWDTLEELAIRAGTTKEDLLANSSHWNVMSPELRLRLLYVIKGNEEKISGLQGKLVAGSATDTDKADLLRLIDSRGDMVRLAAKTGSAYGRALNSLRMEARLALGEDQLLRQQLYRQYSKQIDADKPLLDALARLDPSNPEELQTFLRAVNKPSFREYVQEYWVASILSGPATHERNLIGNAVNAVMENAVIRPVAAGFDAARVTGTGADRAIYLSETPAAVLGLTRGIRQGMRRGWEVLRRGYDPETMKGKLFPVRSAFARSQNRVVREVVGPVVTMPLRLLAASDALFKTMNWTAEIHAQAARAASKAGLSGGEWATEVANLLANPTDEMIEAADDFALKATFNDEASALGKAIMNLRDLPGLAEPESTIGKVGVETYRGIAGFVLPFIKIADRLMVRGFEYTPIGTLKSVGARQAGNFVESADLAARSAIGSVVMAYAASLAMEGRLTAAAPADEAEKAAFFGAGKQAWSVRTDDGLWIPYGGLQPVGTPFALAASFWKGWTENEESPSDERLAWGAQQVGQYVTDQSYMDGLSKLIEAISGGKGQAGRAGADMLTNTAWGFAPYSGLTRSIAKGVDPRVIDAERIADRLWQNVPGASLGMDARLTPWGEEVVPVGGRLRAGLAPGSILLPSKEKPDPLDKELDRLGMPLGYVGKTLSDKLGRGKSRGRWKLAPDEWYYYQQTAGRTSRKLLERLYSKPGYGAWDIEKQREETEKAIGAAREYARIQTVRRHRGLGHV